MFDPINRDQMIDGVGNGYMKEYRKHGETLLGAFPKGHSVASLGNMDAATSPNGDNETKHGLSNPMDPISRV